MVAIKKRLLRHMDLKVLTSLFVGLICLSCSDEEWDFSQRTEPVVPKTVVYINVAEVNPLNALCYTMNGNPFFTHVILSAATVTTDSQSGAVLDCSGDNVVNALQLAPQLQQKGLKVLLSITGSGCGLGFANMTDAQIEDFANQINTVVSTYSLDGVDFNDDNAQYGTNGFPPANSTSYTSLLTVTRAKLGTDKLITVYDNSTGYSRHLTSMTSVIDYSWSDKFGLSLDYRSRIGLANWQYCPFSQKLNIPYVSTDAGTIKNTLRRFLEGNNGALMFFNLRKTPETTTTIDYPYGPSLPIETTTTVTTEDVRQILNLTAERIFKASVEVVDDNEFVEW